MNCPPAATVLNSIHPQLQANTQTLFQPQAACMQPLQAAVQQVMSHPTQVTTAQVTAAQVAAAQATSASIAQSNISVAALQNAGFHINPAIVRRPLQWFTCRDSCSATSGSIVKPNFIFLCSDQCCLVGSTTPVPQLPHLHPHHHQRTVQYGGHHEPDHHKCPGTGGLRNTLLSQLLLSFSSKCSQLKGRCFK